MIVVFIIAIILYLIAWHIQSRSYTYSDEQHSIDRWNSKRLIERAIPDTKVTYPLVVWLICIIAFFMPIVNIISGVIIIARLLGVLNEYGSKIIYRKGKFLIKIISILSKKY